jgi:hypothetical protein
MGPARFHCVIVHEGVDVYARIFLTWLLVEYEWSVSRQCRFTPGKEPLYPLNTMLGGT